MAVEEHELKAIKLALDAQQQFAQFAAEWRNRFPMIYRRSRGHVLQP